MPFTKEFQFPSDEELTVPEVNLSTSYLKAGAIHLGKFCEKENDEFMLCKRENIDPRECLKEGRDVTNCSLKFFGLIKKHCKKEMDQFARCIDQSSRFMNFKHCRKTQAFFDKCMLDKLNLDKPPFGWQAEVHIIHSDRPKPKEEITYYPDAADYFPADKITPEDPKFGLSSFK